MGKCVMKKRREKMRIDREIVEEEINTEEDLIIAVDTVVFKKKVTCRNIVSENYKRNIDARNIDAGNIDAGNIDAGNINAGNINAGFIVCEERKFKSETSKTICKNLTTKRSTYKKKEVKQ